MSVEIIQGHWMDSLRKMPDKHFQMAVTSPPYGVATTGMVCKQLGRDCTCLELNPEYIPLAQERIATMK